MGCFRNLIIYYSTIIVYYSYFISYSGKIISHRIVDVGMIDQIKLKSHTFLCKLFFIFLFLNYYHLYQSFR